MVSRASPGLIELDAASFLFLGLGRKTGSLPEEVASLVMASLPSGEVRGGLCNRARNDRGKLHVSQRFDLDLSQVERARRNEPLSPDDPLRERVFGDLDPLRGQTFEALACFSGEPAPRPLQVEILVERNCFRVISGLLP